MNANGTNQQQLTFNTAQDVGPTWSPDGSKIAWVNVDTGVIWTMDANGSNAAPLSAAGSYYAPVWSPDGTRIAAACGYEICSVSVANPVTDVISLTQSAVQDEYPSWAPAPGTGEEPETEITKRPKDVLSKDKARYESKPSLRRAPASNASSTRSPTRAARARRRTRTSPTASTSSRCRQPPVARPTRRRPRTLSR